MITHHFETNQYSYYVYIEIAHIKFNKINMCCIYSYRYKYDTIYTSCGRSSSVECELPKLERRVRFPSPAPYINSCDILHHGYYYV